jgi:DNA-binding transcriptional ArsR family regulator
MLSSGEMDFLARTLLKKHKISLDELVSIIGVEDSTSLEITIKNMQDLGLVTAHRKKEDNRIETVKLRDEKIMRRYLSRVLRGQFQRALADVALDASKMIFAGGKSFDEAWGYLSNSLYPSFREDFVWLGKLSLRDSQKAGELAKILSENEYKKDYQQILNRKEAVEEGMETFKTMQTWSLRFMGVLLGLSYPYIAGFKEILSGAPFAPLKPDTAVLMGTLYSMIEFPLYALYSSTETFKKDDVLWRLVNYLGCFMGCNLGMSSYLRFLFSPK